MWPLLPLESLPTLIPLRSLIALSSGRVVPWTLESLGALESLTALRTLWALESLGALASLRTGASAAVSGSLESLVAARARTASDTARERTGDALLDFLFDYLGDVTKACGVIRIFTATEAANPAAFHVTVEIAHRI